MPVESIWRQTHPPSEVVLNLARTSGLSPSTLASVAPALVALEASGMVTVRWVPEDLGPLTKLLPTILGAEEHAERFVSGRAGTATSPAEHAGAMADALASMAIAVIDDHDIYSQGLLCALVAGAAMRPADALGFRGFNLTLGQGAASGALCEDRIGQLPKGSCCYASADNASSAAEVRSSGQRVHVLNQVGSLFLRLPHARKALPLMMPNVTAGRCTSSAAQTLRYAELQQTSPTHRPA